LRYQLRVTEEDFYRCVNDGVVPPRPAPQVPEPPEDALDAKLVTNLIRKVGCSQGEVAAMSKQDAVQRWTDYLVEGGC
jgi:hypothetical protein